ncbi:hypothetical protein ACLQ2R_09725 [Streptosporangium sp. DT93]|uniref:hypothetical protein n=1 Tax=Streptosporangium sp. DT93 TaxID=3393428 RepID=UPI003CF24F55
MSHPAEPMDISPADLKRRKEDFHVENNELGRAITQAMSALDGLGAFWGDDEAGQKFAGGGGKGYLAARDEAMKHAGQLRDAYFTIGDNLGLVGDNVGGANWATVEAMVTAIVCPQIDARSKAELD